MAGEVRGEEGPGSSLAAALGFAVSRALHLPSRSAPLPMRGKSLWAQGTCLPGPLPQFFLPRARFQGCGGLFLRPVPLWEDPTAGVRTLGLRVTESGRVQGGGCRLHTPPLPWDVVWLATGGEGQGLLASVCTPGRARPVWATHHCHRSGEKWLDSRCWGHEISGSW